MAIRDYSNWPHEKKPKWLQRRILRKRQLEIDRREYLQDQERVWVEYRIDLQEEAMAGRAERQRYRNEDPTRAIDFFGLAVGSNEDYRFLSNFHASEVELDGAMYPTVEHAYQAAKTLDHEKRSTLRYLATPSLAKKGGRRLPLRHDWEQVKLGIMERLLRQKFAVGTELRWRLIQTRPAKLIEGNWWGDRFWGEYNGQGHNHLGKLLMKIRDEG